MFLFKENKVRSGDVDQVVECLSSKCKALDPIVSTALTGCTSGSYP